MKKSAVKWCVALALSVSVAFGGVVITQAAYDDIACEYEVWFRPRDLPKPNYD